MQVRDKQGNPLAAGDPVAVAIQKVLDPLVIARVTEINCLGRVPMITFAFEFTLPVMQNGQVFDVIATKTPIAASVSKLVTQ